MILSGTFTFDGPRERVWDILQDPDVLAHAQRRTQLVTAGAPWGRLHGRGAGGEDPQPPEGEHQPAKRDDHADDPDPHGEAAQWPARRRRRTSSP